jgi:hypothetical protein
MFGRYHVLGDDLKMPRGPGTWKVTLAVQGKTAAVGARLLTATPLDFGRQHVLSETCRSAELLDKPPDARHPERRQVLWSLRAGSPPGQFRAHCEYHVTMDLQQPYLPMARLTQQLYAAPQPGESLQKEPLIECDHPEVTELARRLTAGLSRTDDQAEALFRFVDREVDNEPHLTGADLGAVDCLRQGSGDAVAQSRLLVALCRSRGIPARLVTGVILSRGHDQAAHVWAEAWVRDYWQPMCPISHHFGKVPSTYLIFGFGDQPLVRGRHVTDLSYGLIVERAAAAETTAGPSSKVRQALVHLSLFALPPAEQRLVEFLLLVPIAALIVCLFRNVIGLYSFGTFAPALLGLAFRDLHSLPGILVFVGVVLLGWVMRRVLDHYHLLQVPRMAFLLSLVVLVLIGAIVAANFQEMAATRYVSIFPIVILVGMIERFWTLEAEDGTAASFRTLLGTMVIAATISLVLSLKALPRHMIRFPETLGVIMALQLLLGRYTGYRLMELFRFRDFLRPPATEPWVLRNGPWLVKQPTAR